VSSEIVIREDIRKECLELLKDLREKSLEVRLTAKIFRERSSEMCNQMIDIVDSALSVVKLLELTE